MHTAPADSLILFSQYCYHVTMSISIKITAEVRVYRELLISWMRKMHFHGQVLGTSMASQSTFYETYHE